MYALLYWARMRAMSLVLTERGTIDSLMYLLSRHAMEAKKNKKSKQYYLMLYLTGRKRDNIYNKT